MRKVLFLLAIIYPLLLLSNDPKLINEEFTRANLLYQKGEFEKAKEIYEKLVNLGTRDERLFFNLGNTYYRLNEFHRAILFYERAKILAPFDEDINFNLQIANLRVVDKFQPVPKFFIYQWWENLRDSFNSDQWATISIVLIWLSAFAFTIFLIVRTSLGRKITFLLGLIFILLFLFASVLSYSRYSYENAHDFAIVFSTNAYIKSSPEDNATDLFILHQGTKVQLIDQVGIWSKIRLPNGNIGWIKKDEIEVI
ncbi:MAG: tetratricopeptide repeat protein [Candidatus Kapaibacteriales bacterium]